MILFLNLFWGRIKRTALSIDKGQFIINVALKQQIIGTWDY